MSNSSSNSRARSARCATIGLTLVGSAWLASRPFGASAAETARPLLLMHGTADDNVRFEHSLRLTQALEASGKLFETVIHPGQTHGVSGRGQRLHVDRAATDFFVRRLQP